MTSTIDNNIKVIELNLRDYKNRNGYDPHFLEKEIPLPGISDVLTNDIVKLKNSNDGELKYTNFSLVMSKSRKLPFFTAVNIDGSQMKLLERTRDAWYYDPRIEKEFQYGPGLYSNNDLDRGHLVRRLDPVWGPNFKDANEDTFHFTNCSPQHKNLNQKTWLYLEDYILKNTDIHDLKVNVFTGPIFNNNDLIYRGKYLIPAEFWKVVAIIKNDDKKSISATAYLQTQKQLIENLKFVFGEFKTYQVQIKKIESLTGLDFDYLRNFDPLSKVKGIPIKMINTENDIVF
ncbi:MAG TPA: DNA/RNA non-specific endonuclease [Nitrososphaeraceae archaeon]|nr:DNA/RNA non-specific endonuclease [Nitrososphaeraceae archaeon]